MKFSIFPNSQILILFFLLRPLARHLMPLLVAYMSCASIRNQNVPYRTTRQRQNIHYSLFIQGISRSIYAEGKGSSIIYAAGKIFIIHYSLNFARPLRPLRPDLIRTPFFLLFQANIIRRSLPPVLKTLVSRWDFWDFQDKTLEFSRIIVCTKNPNNPMPFIKL